METGLPPHIKEKWPDFHLLTREEILDLFRLCTGRDPRMREAATGLLLNPGNAAPVEYYLRFAAFLSESRIRPRDVPEELLQAFYELIASTREIPRDLHGERFFKKILLKASLKHFSRLLGRRFPVRPFIDHFAPKRIFPGNSTSGFESRKRWRLLRKRLHLESEPEKLADSSLEITLADLQQLFSAGRLCRLPESARKKTGSAGAGLMAPASLRESREIESLKSAWRRLGRPFLARGRAARGAIAAPLPLRKLCWGGASNQKVAFWDRLTEMQAEELSSIRHLARAVSSRTGRVVLSWHNASLAACGGWAFGEIAAQFPSNSLYNDFVQAVLEDAARIRTKMDFTAASNLVEMRIGRLFAPKAAHALDESRALFSSLSAVSLSPPSLICTEGRLPPSFSKGGPGGILLHPAPAEDSRYEWPGALSPHQRITPAQILTWSQTVQQGWTEGLILLLALTTAGQKMLDSGRISSLVLPWIDKFFISSRRRADSFYIERLFRFLSLEISQPLILFWEDTAHRQVPSFSLALGDLAGRGLPVRGIGIFNPDLSSSSQRHLGRAEALEIICGEYPRKQLFALRPVDDNHCPDAFRMVFGDLDRNFFRSYDSSWKDNLVFIYTGTQVFPLLSVQTEMESVVPWVSDGHVRTPFGAWFRRRLRRLALGRPHLISDPLSMAYASWANLL